MKGLESIRELYKPVQPAVSIEDDIIQYKEFYPSKDIESFVYCYWQLKVRKKLNEPYLYRVVSDGCIDIFFEASNPEHSFIMGFYRKYTEFQIGLSFNYYGIRFFPSAFSLLFNINAKTLSNQSQRLMNILPEFSAWLSKLSQVISAGDVDWETKLNHEIKRIIELNKIVIDVRFYNSLIEILQRNGFIDIENDLDVGLGIRQLRRIYNYYIGTTPKAFSNVVRFQHILNAKPSLQSLKTNKIYYDVGFYDQAHFIKSFKAFYGVSPSQAFR